MKKTIAIIALVWFFIPSNNVNAQGCMDGGSEDGVKVVGYLQSQYEYQFLGDNVAPLHGFESNNGFSFNRARLGVVGNIPYDFSYYALAELSPTKGGPYILDAFITYKRLDPWLNISFGQFKGQFGLELTTACQSLHTVDRSRMVNELASPFRDFGVLFYGGTNEKKIFGLENENIFSWKFSITNGTGQNLMDNNKAKDYTGRLVFSPWESIALGGSFRYGKQASAAGIDSLEDERQRWGVDFSFEKWNFIVQAEYIDAIDKGSTLEGGGCGGDPVPVLGDFKKNGLMVQALYKTKWEIQPVVKFEMYDPDTEGLFDQQRDFTFGFNYFFNEWARLQFNYVYRSEESGNSVLTYNEIENDFMVIQLQVVF